MQTVLKAALQQASNKPTGVSYLAVEKSETLFAPTIGVLVAATGGERSSRKKSEDQDGSQV